jgi:threonine/homoserine/homoserine lactone efflux protein
METILSILLILGALLIAAISPGPSFVLVAKYAIGASRNDGVAAAIGMGVGGVILSILALTGLHAVLTNVPILFVILKLLGGIYLVYLAIRFWLEAKQTLEFDSDNSKTKSTFKMSFLVALVTQLSNPKAAITYGVIFAALLPADITSSFYFILPPLVFMVETGWYLIVTLTLSSASPRAVYLKSKSLFDRIAGSVMAGLGIKLLSSTVSD